jgi:hypothetical protein
MNAVATAAGKAAAASADTVSSYQSEPDSSNQVGGDTLSIRMECCMSRVSCALADLASCCNFWRPAVAAAQTLRVQ